MNGFDWHSLLVAPNLYYVIGVAVALILLGVVLLALRSRSKRIEAMYLDELEAEEEAAREAEQLEAEDDEDDEEPAAVVEESTPEPEAEPEPEPEPVAGPKSLSEGLAKTRKGFIGRIGKLFSLKKEIDEDILEELEEVLFTADIGAKTAQRMFDSIKEKSKRKELQDAGKVNDLLREEMRNILLPHQRPWEMSDAQPKLLMIVGVNGVGKTTTIGKLALHYKAQGLKVILAAGDTFRAAAVEQLQEWGRRAEVEVVAGQEKADPGSVIYNAIERAKAQQADLVIADTAGRLHTKFNLMEELRKVFRVAGKALGREPDQTWLVLDANTGQNAINQAAKFNEALTLSGLVLTKLDGTAKGGVVLGVTEELHVPVRFIGIGEGIHDLRPFDAPAFVEALFD